MNADERWHELIALHQTGQMTKDGFAELEAVLRESSKARIRFHQACRIDSRLRREAENADDLLVIRPADHSSTIQARGWQRSGWIAGGLAAAAMVSLSLFAWGQLSRSALIATLVSGEDASWESSLPTAPGSTLTPGYLKLNTGIATIRFASGAEVILEAPAHLILETPMRGKLLAGSAVVEVPESAIGFVMEAPGGYAVDFGTQFAISVNAAGDSSDFEVLKGEIAVHHPATGKEVRLTKRQGASISELEMVTFDSASHEPAFTRAPKSLRIGTNGRADGVDRRNKHNKYYNPEVLFVRQTDEHNWDMRAFFRFDLSKVDLQSVKSARLRLNLVPSGWGLAARLPLSNTFAVYGVTRADKEEWSSEPRWEDSAGPEDGMLLGRFDIPRSQQTGSVGIENDKLLEFLEADVDKKVTFVIVRETGLIDGEGKGLVHTFATDRNPHAPGPILEFSMKDSHP